MAAAVTACLKLTPIVVYIIYAYSLLFLGIYALVQDDAVRNHACGKRYHIWKYTFLNVILWVFAAGSYLGWRGGGEGARARAVVLTVFYFGFAMWGILLWQAMDSECASHFDKQFHIIYLFHFICAVTDGVFFVLYFLHESILGKLLGSDFTILPEVSHKFSASAPRPPDNVGGIVHHIGASPAVAQQSPTPPGLPPQLSYEYEKIMAHQSSSSSLPQTTP